MKVTAYDPDLPGGVKEYEMWFMEFLQRMSHNRDRIAKIEVTMTDGTHSVAYPKERGLR